MPVISPQIYYVNKSDKRATRGFYSEERAGFVRVSDLVYDFTNLLVTDLGVCDLKSFKLIETINSNSQVLANAVNSHTSGITITSNVLLGISDSNTSERVRIIVAPGVGYAVGASLTHLIANTTNNVEIRVTSIDSMTGGVTGFEILNSGSYYTTTGSSTASASKALTYKARVSTATPVVNQDYTEFCTLALAGQVSDDGTTGLGQGGTSGIGGTKSIPNGLLVGQEVFLGPTANINSTIPANTTVAQIAANVIGATTRITLRFSNSITVNNGDTLYFRGTGALLKDNQYRVPNKFTAIVESNGRINPLASSATVQGTLAATVSANTQVQLTSLTGGIGGVPAEVYAGQLFNSGSTNSTIVSANVNIVTGTANLVLSTPISLSSGATANIRFDPDYLQPWRLAFDVIDSQTLNIYAATHVQLQDNGNIARVTNYNGEVIDHAGIMGNLPTSNITVGGRVVDKRITVGNVDQGFVNRSLRVGSYPEAYPMNYAVTLNNRGMFFGVWEGSWSAIHRSAAQFAANGNNWFNWFVVQRPVDRITGRVLTAGRAPVFCINSVGYNYWKFIVRERDVLHPTQGDPEQTSYTYTYSGNVVVQTTPYRVPADQHTDDSFAILNTTNQIALSENSKYLISFLHNLTTPRFRYSEELDMIGQTSADVCMAGNDVLITAYQESGQRAYKALPANKPYNTGLRICVLRDVV